MKNKIIFFACIHVFISDVICQNKNNYLGFCINVGYKSIYQDYGIVAYSRIVNHLDINVGYSRGKFNGDGYCAGMRYVPLKTKWQPFIGIQYSKNFGREFNVKADGNSTKFKLPSCEFYYGDIGTMYKFKLDESIVENMFVLLIFNLSYRYTPYNGYKLNYIEGTNPYKFENSLNKRIGNGLGGSLSIAVLFGKSK